MALTEAQKKTIEEEEEYRGTLRNDKSGSEKKKTHPAIGCLIIALVIFVGVPLGIGVLIGISSLSSSSSDSKPSEPQIERRTDFKSAVTFTGTQFVITNADDNDCIGSLMSVNGKYSLEGYTLEQGKVYTVGAGEFTDGDSTRFNPFAIKPASFSIICRGNNKLSQASWTGQF
jgi:hypothetical protein